ncbi:MAG: DUF2232 domain-containing protein [Clostridiales bacterium]|nr:DUF2232 domain-containing protein [Clostridiales bacterium]
MRTGSLIYSPKGFLVSIAITAAILIFLAGSAFAPPYLLTAIVFVLPIFLQMLLRVWGPVPAGVSLIMIFLTVMQRINLTASFYALTYLSIPLLTYVYCLYKKFSLEKTVLFIVLGYTLIVLSLYAYTFQLLGNAPFDVLSEQLIVGLGRMSERDGLLSASYQYGLLALPAHLAENPLVQTAQGEWTFAPEVLSEFYKQIATRASLWLRALVPSLISSYSLYLALGGVFLSNYYGNRQAQRRAFRQDKELVLPAPNYPEFSRWYIPKAFVVPLWIIGGVSIVSRLIPQPGIMMAGSMLYNIFAAFFSIQGLSFVNHFQKQKGTKPIYRGLSMAALVLILPQAALLLGMFDQFNASRKNKEIPNQTKFDNRRDEK